MLPSQIRTKNCLSRTSHTNTAGAKKPNVAETNQWELIDARCLSNNCPMRKLRRLACPDSGLSGKERRRVGLLFSYHGIKRIQANNRNSASGRAENECDEVNGRNRWRNSNGMCVVIRKGRRLVSLRRCVRGRKGKKENATVGGGD